MSCIFMSVIFSAPHYTARTGSTSAMTSCCGSVHSLVLQLHIHKKTQYLLQCCDFITTKKPVIGDARRRFVVLTGNDMRTHCSHNNDCFTFSIPHSVRHTIELTTLFPVSISAHGFRGKTTQLHTVVHSMKHTQTFIH